MDGETRKPGNDPRILLRVSEQFLRRRHFDDCRKYAHQAHQVDSNFPGVAEILAVADVLLASKHKLSTGFDWYEIMQLNRYSEDSVLIRQRFDHFYGLLNPSNNKFPFADEAFGIVCDAWYVLSSPDKKLEFDESLRKLINDDEKSEANPDSVFWTACPYCYHLYEYPRVYFELCVRCPNDKCSRAFTCIEIDRPPVEVLQVGKYMCSGFLPAGFQNGLWNPFTPLNKQNAIPNIDSDKFVYISDDDEDEVEIKNDRDKDKPFDSGARELKMESGNPTKKPNSGRKKAIAKNCKKITGAGNRVREVGFDHPLETDDCVFF